MEHTCIVALSTDALLDPGPTFSPIGPTELGAAVGGLESVCNTIQHSSSQLHHHCSHTHTLRPLRWLPALGAPSSSVLPLLPSSLRACPAASETCGTWGSEEHKANTQPHSPPPLSNQAPSPAWPVSSAHREHAGLQPPAGKHNSSHGATNGMAVPMILIPSFSQGLRQS